MGRRSRWLYLFVALLIISLCTFFFALPRYLANTRNEQTPYPLPELSQRALTLHPTLWLADLHADSMLWDKSITDSDAPGFVTLERLFQGNFGLQVFSAVTHSPFGINYVANDHEGINATSLLSLANRWPVSTWFDMTERAVYQAEKLKSVVAEQDGRVSLITSQKDLQTLIAAQNQGQQRLGAMLSVEGLQTIEKNLESLQRLIDSGFRIFGLTHLVDNAVGGSSTGLQKNGLTEFGRQAVKTLNQQKMIIDLSHASAPLVSDVLAFSSRPVLVSHTGVQATCVHNRNLSDEQIKQIANKGGLIGIGFWQSAICGLSPDSIALAINHVVKLVGVNHVALGSDFDGAVKISFHPGQMVYLTDALLRHAYSEEDIAKIMGLNLQRFLMEQLP